MQTSKLGMSDFGKLIFMLVCAIVLLTVGTGYAANSAPVLWTESTTSYTCCLQWGTPGNGGGQFNEPSGVAVDTSGYVYVADTSNQRIPRFDSYGVIQDWYGPIIEVNGFDIPVGVVADDSGNFYVADSWNGYIKKFNSSGEFLAKLGERDGGPLQCFNSVAMDASGNLYVTDSCNNCVSMINTTGTIVAEWGTKGSGDGQFDIWAGAGVAVDFSGFVYVVDNGNNRIQKFDSTGNFIIKWGTRGSGDGQFDSPNGVAVDSSGNVYVADTRNNRIQKFDSTGNFITKWGTSGSSDGQFNAPKGVAVNASGFVYVADTGNNRMQKFAPAIVADDSVSISMSRNGAPVAFDLTLYVSNEDGGYRGWSILTNPSHGTANLESDYNSYEYGRDSMMITYTPTTDFVGEDSFEVKVCNAYCVEADTITVNVTVTPLLGILPPIEYIPGPYNYYLPCFKSGNGYWTGLGISNSSVSESSPLKVIVYDFDGSYLTDELKTLPIDGQVAFPVATTLDGRGWMHINSHQPLAGLAILGHTEAVSLMTAIPFVSDLADCLVIPHIVHDNIWDTSVLICNPQTVPVTVILTYVDSNGVTQGKKRYNLAIHGSNEYNLAELSGSTMAGKVYIKASHGIAAFAIYSNQKSGGTYFSGINAEECE